MLRRRRLIDGRSRNDGRKFRQELGVVLPQIPINRCVSDEIRQIARRNHQVQHVVSLSRLDGLDVLLQRLHLPFNPSPPRRN